MNEGPIFIAAGTGAGAKRIEIEGIGSEDKPFVKVDGRTNIEIIVNEAAKTKNDRPIYIWGSVEYLNKVLAKVIKREENKREIVITPEKRDIIESAFFSYLEYLRRSDKKLRDISSNWTSLKDFDWKLLREFAKDKGFFSKKVDLVACDIPLISHNELDFLFEQANPNVIYSYGWSLKEPFEQIIRTLNSEHNINFDYKKSKMNFFSFLRRVQGKKKSVDCRFNNFHSGKPLHLPLYLLECVPKLYEFRDLIKDGLPNVNNLMNIARLAREVEKGFSSENLEKKINKIQFGVYLGSVLTSASLVHLSHYLKDKQMLKKALGYHYLDVQTIEKSGARLMGDKISIYITNLVGPLFDIDTAYEYHFIKDNFSKIRDAIADYYLKHEMQVIHK